MKWFVMTMLVCGLLAGAVRAGEADFWTAVPSDNWTATDDVQVRYFFTENGNNVGQAHLLIGPLLPGQNRPFVTSEFVDSGKNICIAAEAYRSAEPDRVVQARNNGLCHRFPFGPLDSFTITVTP